MKKGRKTTKVLLIFAFVIGLSLLLYPAFSNYWNSIFQSKAVAGYASQVNELDEAECARMLKEAEEYNKSLYDRTNRFRLDEEQVKKYPKMLKLPHTDVMAYVEIPEINVVLPIYHGTDDKILESAIGHLDWTSLQVGGKNTHSVISGHRGLPSAKLFSDLDELQEGDYFVIQVLDRTLTYEIDLIKIVTPEEVTPLTIVEGKDLCTLVTCTPYGVNTHRLLVRGHRVANIGEDSRIVSEATPIDPFIVATVIGIPILIILGIAVLISDNSKRDKREIKERCGADEEIS